MYAAEMKESQGGPEDASASALAGDLRILIGRLRRKLREQAHIGDLTWSQVAVLGHLESAGPATVTALAQALGMRPQSMGANVAILETAGLVSGVPDPADGRQTLLSLTPACRKWIKAGRAARQDWLSRAIQSKLTPPEQRELSTAIELLKRLVDQ
jgi:DNA-binding MarR family transcriptional regulator